MDTSSNSPVTVIIPTRNRASLLDVTLSSYLNQEEVEEVIVIDDSSNDENGNLLERMSRRSDKIVLLHNPKRRGSAGSKNRGLAMARTEFVMFGEDDVFLEDRYISTLLLHLTASRAGIAAGKLSYVKVEDLNMARNTPRTSGAQEPLFDRTTLTADFSCGCGECMEVPFVHSCFLARRDLILDYPFFEGYRINGYREETDPQIRLGADGWKILLCGRSIAYHVQRGARTGGQWDGGLIAHEMWTLVNNWIFLRRNWTQISTVFPNLSSPLHSQIMLVMKLAREHTRSVLRRIGSG